MPWDLTLQLTQKLSMVATIAFILSKTKILQRIFKEKPTLKDKLILITVFSLQAIIGTYTGISIDDALANSRVVGIMVAGLLGGPILGASVGAIAGIHRYFLGGFTAGACIGKLCCGKIALPPEVNVKAPADDSYYHKFVVDKDVVLYQHIDLPNVEGFSIGVSRILGYKYLVINGWKLA
jgi:hypothetical protein